MTSHETREVRSPDGRPRLRSRAPGQTDPRTPYRVLVAIMLACAAFAMLFGALPTHDGSVRQVDMVVAGSLVLCSLLVWFVLPRLRDDLGLDVAIVVGSVIAGYCTSLINLQESQFLIAFGLAGLGVFTAYFLPRRRLVVLLLVMTGSFAVGVAINPLLPTPTSYVVAVLMIWGMSLMVSRLVEELRAQAMYDTLTGTLNRHGLDVAVTSVVGSAARAGQTVTVGLVDLDGFKSYNDRHGHIAGDELLAELTSAWMRELRAGDILARYGGDEFALVLPFSSRADAPDVVRRLRAAHPAPWSVGFADWDPSENLYDALHRADEELYARKRERDGRPQVPEALLTCQSTVASSGAWSLGTSASGSHSGLPGWGSPGGVTTTAAHPRAATTSSSRVRPFVAAVAPLGLVSNPPRASTRPVALSHAELMSPSSTTVPASCSSHQDRSSRACVVPCS